MSWFKWWFTPRNRYVSHRETVEVGKGIDFFSHLSLSSRWAYYLYAFSSYLFRTWLFGIYMGAITNTPDMHPSRSSCTKGRSSWCSSVQTGYRPSCLTMLWTPIMYCFEHLMFDGILGLRNKHFRWWVLFIYMIWIWNIMQKEKGLETLWISRRQEVLFALTKDQWMNGASILPCHSSTNKTIIVEKDNNFLLIQIWAKKKRR